MIGATPPSIMFEIHNGAIPMAAITTMSVITGRRLCAGMVYDFNQEK